MSDRKVTYTKMTGAKMANPDTNKAVIQLDDARLSLSSADGMVDILRGISLSISAGETVGVLGPSGAGKTSLLMIMAGLESLTKGQIALAERPTRRGAARERDVRGPQGCGLRQDGHRPGCRRAQDRLSPREDRRRGRRR